jgi:uncharacterized protein (DUF1499 family)
MVVSQIEDTIHNLTQGEKPVRTYVGELRRAWEDLDHLAPLVLPHSECVEAMKKWIEDRRVMKFLKWLNLAFEGCANASSSIVYTRRGHCSHGTRSN